MPQQYAAQSSDSPSSNYTPYTSTSSAMAPTTNGGYHERRNQNLTATDVYTSQPPSALSSSYPSQNAPISYSHSRWPLQTQGQYNTATNTTPHATHLYPNQLPLAQVNLASQHPASPPRPYACDMCPLSFNRQHDLKRHRETHSGEKPYLCNGGCGKTFTRKDALKRHQVVAGQMTRGHKEVNSIAHDKDVQEDKLTFPRGEMMPHRL
ncbi:hypothetical protein M378DRAFT_452363 [Amanita muscaria Koide BX008]|uniref:C2H2-type domain-containing protein n=1 Tax=Amanita muscaria (strain Koide BX008) TaxID=946122 RepID=A0A0C2SRP5_AMAMK|nr:hypothetical protein M378DRAFT_452363 [Amanita muscaria Koide BX008]